MAGVLLLSVGLVVGFAVGWAVGWRTGFREGRSTIPLATIRGLATHLRVCEGAPPEAVIERLRADLDLDADEARRSVEAVVTNEVPARAIPLRRIG